MSKLIDAVESLSFRMTQKGRWVRRIDVIDLIRHHEAQEAAERRLHTGVFWVLPGIRSCEILINGEQRPDLEKKLIYAANGNQGYVVHGLTYDELCNIQIRKLP